MNNETNGDDRQNDEQLIQEAFSKAQLIQRAQRQPDSSPLPEIADFSTRIITQYRTARERPTPEETPKESLKKAFWQVKAEIMEATGKDTLSIEELELPELFTSIYELSIASPPQMDIHIRIWTDIKAANRKLNAAAQFIPSAEYINEHLILALKTDSTFRDHFLPLSERAEDFINQYIDASIIVIDASAELLQRSEQDLAKQQPPTNQEEHDELIAIKSSVLGARVLRKEQIQKLSGVLKNQLKTMDSLKQVSSAHEGREEDITQALQYNLSKIDLELHSQTSLVAFRREELEELIRRSEEHESPESPPPTPLQSRSDQLRNAITATRTGLEKELQSRLAFLIETQEIPKRITAGTLSIPNNLIQAVAANAAKHVLALWEPTNLFNAHRDQIKGAVDQGIKSNLTEQANVEQVLEGVFQTDQASGIFSHAIEALLKNPKLSEQIHAAAKLAVAGSEHNRMRR